MPGSAGTMGKQAAFAATCDATMPAEAGIEFVAEQIRLAVSADRAALSDGAAGLAERCERDFAAVREALD